MKLLHGGNSAHLNEQKHLEIKKNKT